jgi:hypothetical protein
MLLHHVRCPLPGVCVGARPLLNPIRKTHPTTKYRHQVNSSDKQRYQSKEQQSVTVARLSARLKHPPEHIIASEPQMPLLGHHHVLCIMIHPNRNCNQSALRFVLIEIATVK